MCWRLGEHLPSRQKTQCRQKQRRKTDGIDDNGCLKQATGLVAVCGKLAARADDADQTEDEGEYPPGTSTKAMSLADDGSNNKRGEEDDELEDGDASSCVELHCAWVYSNEDLNRLNQSSQKDLRIYGSLKLTTDTIPLYEQPDDPSLLWS